MNENMKIQKLREECKKYLIARKRFLEIANNEELLRGNDNIIGSRIAEFVAWQFLNERNRKPVLNQNLVQPGYDIFCGKDNKKVTVKSITNENLRGRTTQLKDGWDEFILVEFNNKYKINKIGFISRSKFGMAVKKKHYSKNPTVSRSMLNNKGLFKKYGELFSGPLVKKYI